MNKKTSMKAIILAAGRGSRMKDSTAGCPKCLLHLAGKPLLQWQMEALRAAGASGILVVRGYLNHLLTTTALPWAKDFQVADNTRWESSNMLRSLLCADAFARKAFAEGVTRLVVSYADIVYPADHVCALSTCPQHVSMTYDVLWEPLWRLRFGDPLLDAETFRQEKGLLCEIGNKPTSLAEVQGQYMGLLSFSPTGWDRVCEICTALGDRLDKTDMTTFLRLLMASNIAVGAVPVQGRWCEADNENDLESYKKALDSGSWAHDWR